MKIEEELNHLLESLTKEEFDFIGRNGEPRSTIPFKLRMEKFGKKYKAGNNEIGFLMDKLEKDGYVVKSSSDGNRYKITVDGLQFYNHGGYIVDLKQPRNVAQLKENQQSTNTFSNGKIFISYSTEDKVIVKKFCDLILSNSLNINIQEKVFCTAIDGSKPKSGEKFNERIKAELINAIAVIQFISQSYKKSEVCLNEMGAAWVLSENVIPIVVERGKYEVGFIHVQTQQINLSKPEQILRFVQDHKGTFIPEKFDLVVLNEKIKELHKIYNSIYGKSKQRKITPNKDLFEGKFYNQNTPPKLIPDQEQNDHYFNNKIPIDLRKFNIELSIKTNSNYWRCGVRFSKTKSFRFGRHHEFPFYHFYKDKNMSGFGASYYDEENKGNILGTSQVENNSIRLKIHSVKGDTYLTTSQLQNCNVALSGYRYCQILGWGDQYPFEIEYVIKLIER